MIVMAQVSSVMVEAVGVTSEVVRDAARQDLLMVSPAATALIQTPVNQINVCVAIVESKRIG